MIRSHGQGSTKAQNILLKYFAEAFCLRILPKHLVEACEMKHLAKVFGPKHLAEAKFSLWSLKGLAA